MRLPRSGLVERLARPGAAPVVLLEAPSGYGKSWLLRQAGGADTLRWRATVGAFDDSSFRHASRVVIEDAHALRDDEIDQLVDYLEFTDGHIPLLIAGRLLDDRLHEVAELVDGLILDHLALSVTAEEIVEFLPTRSMRTAEQLIDVTEGEVRAVSATLTQLRRGAGDSAVAFATRVVRANCTAAYELQRTPDDGIVAVLARCPGLSRHVLETLGGREVIKRLVRERSANSTSSRRGSRARRVPDLQVFRR